MICSLCGRNFPGSEAVQDVRYTTGEGGGKPIPMMLCQSCVEERRRTLLLYCYVFGALLAIVLLIGWLLSARMGS